MEGHEIHDAEDRFSSTTKMVYKNQFVSRTSKQKLYREYVFQFATIPGSITKNPTITKSESTVTCYSSKSILKSKIKTHHVIVKKNVFHLNRL